MYLTQARHRAAQQTPDLPATIGGDRLRTWRSPTTGWRGSPRACEIWAAGRETGSRCCR
jgi:hypothetical protein